MAHRFHRLFSTACIALALFGAVDRADAAPIVVMAGGTNKIVYLPLILASQLGYFKDEGLNVEILSQVAGVDTSTELLAGAIQGAVGYYDHTIDLQSRGTDVESLVVLVKSAGEVELVSTRAAAHIKTMGDVKGSTLGVTGLGASTAFLTRYLASQAGLRSSDYTLLPVGSNEAFITALNDGQMAAGMIEEPAATRILASGRASILVDMRGVDNSRRALGGDYASACFYARRQWVDTHPEQAQKLVSALVRGLDFIAHHNAEQIAAVVPTDFYGGNRALYVQALKASLPTFTTDGSMPAGAPETALRTLSSASSAIQPRHIDLSRTYTDAFVKVALRRKNAQPS